MSRRLVVLNALLLIIALAAVGYIVRELRVRPVPNNGGIVPRSTR